MILAYGGENPSAVLNNSKKKRKKKVRLAKFANPIKSKAVNQLKSSIKKARRAQS